MFRLATFVLAIAIAIPALAQQPPTTPEVLLKQHNDLRARSGLSPLILDANLTAAAQEKSRAMSQTQSMNHYIRGYAPAEVAYRAGYHHRGVAENIAMGQPNERSVTNTWWNSGGHRANMLGGYQHVGFGLVRDVRGVLWWTALFANPHKPTVSVVKTKTVTIKP